MSQSRLTLQKEYWDKAALDENVDIKYISDIDTESCLNELHLPSGKTLEIGSGVGRLLPPEGFGIDISKNMISIARKRRPDCEFKLCKDSIPYEDESFDVVYSFLVFQHLKPGDISKYFKESYRVLKYGGVFTFQFIEGTEREPFSNHYSKREIEKWLKSAEFDYSPIYKQSNVQPLWTYVRVEKI